MSTNGVITSPRTALVTGAARGIGAAIATELASQGHRVAVADILDDAAAQTAAAIAGIAVHLDVTDSASVSAAVAQAEELLGPLEILVNNAGWDEFKPFLDTEEPLWERIIEINYKGCLRCCRAVVPGMVERGYGRVVNISSDAARVGSSLEAVYSGAKGAVLSFSKTLAREVARHGVTVNVVCPGPTDTALLGRMFEGSDDAARAVEGLKRAVPMRRLAQPQDIAPAVAFLASDAAGYITGQTLSVSGGLTMA
jgi:2-hydroxycyclohexanecarboxyl-CoA dehydrogenase